MDKLTEEIESLTNDDLNALRSALEVPTSGGKPALVKALLCYRGINLLFSHFSSSEISVLHQLWRSKTGLTYSELSRELELETDAIEAIANKLQLYALVYVLKNRKHLNNRLDKIYLHQPIEEILSFSKDDEFARSLGELEKALAEKPAKTTEIPKKSLPLIQALIDAGGVLTYTSLILQNILDTPDTTIQEALQKELITIHHTASAPFATILVLSAKGFSGGSVKKESVLKNSINNRFYLLNNTLSVYDTITSRGLYLTQQHEFRKTDFKRVSDALISLYDQKGLSIDPDDAARFSMHILYRMGALSLKKDAVQIDIATIEKDIADPEKFCTHALRSISKKQPDDPLFASPFPTPTNEEIQTLLDFIKQNPGAEFTRLRISFILGKVMKNPALIRTTSDTKSLPSEKFSAALRYSLLFGLVIYTEGVYSVRSEKKEVTGGAAYINPDFTLLVPTEEIPDDMLYKILSCTEIRQNDVVLHCRITRDSILAAHKRRLHPDKIIAEFEPHLKNGIPQNMMFMIREWISQSLEVSIKEALVLKTNHPSFIDDLLAGNLKNSIIERISPNHAVIRRDSIDDIVRAATKHSAIISLFGE